MSADRANVLAKFRDIGLERVRNLNQALLSIENGEGDSGTVDLAMREIHTLKGESRMLGLPGLNHTAHRTEDILLHARSTDRLRDAELLQRIYSGLDLLADLLAAEPDAMEAADDERVRSFVEETERLLAEQGRETSTVTSAAVAPAPGAPAEPDASPAPVKPPASGTSQHRVRRETIDDITRTTGEVGVLQAQLRRSADDAAALQERALEALALGPAGDDVAAWTDRVRTLLDRSSDVLRSMRDLGFEVSLRQQRIQDSVASMRLSQAGTLFGSFPRAVRDLARELGKEARVQITGGHVGADQQILDVLSDPLLHLIRNAVDHGLEPPNAREATGKPRAGTIHLSARHAGRFVEIHVADDGRGLDPRVIADTAVRRGLLSESDVAHMSDQELFAQLLRPAFSTRQSVSDVSGRGVGLDVVKSTVEDLGGSLQIRSTLGSGTTFVLRLPVSIAVLDALVLDLGLGLYAVPSAYVERVLRVDGSTIEETAGGTWIRLSDEIRAPLHDLPQLLGLPHLPPSENGESGVARILVLIDDVRRLALRVPEFIGEMTLVQDALDPFLKGLRLVTGTALLQGGRRVVLLNAIQVFELAHHARDGTRRPDIEPEKRDVIQTVLVVEDSDLTRDMLASTFLEAGYRVLEAPNGEAGLDRFLQEDVDLVITDLEMPRLDGFELMQAIRRDPRGARIPLVVCSTKDSPEIRRRAAEAGGDAYLPKAAFDREEALALVAQLLRPPSQEETR